MNEKILALANELLDELEKEGYDTLHEYQHYGQGGKFPLHSIDILVYRNNALTVEHVCNNWKLRGERANTRWERLKEVEHV